MFDCEFVINDNIYLLAKVTTVTFTVYNLQQARCQGYKSLSAMVQSSNKNPQMWPFVFNTALVVILLCLKYTLQAILLRGNISVSNKDRLDTNVIMPFLNRFSRSLVEITPLHTT